ncbi:hypothetical protein P9112_006652 [Eukaryota sp. TZLM1-RC]
MFHKYDNIIFDTSLSIEFDVPFGLSPQFLYSTLGRFGYVNTCKIIRPRTTDISKCVAHVTFFRMSSYRNAFDHLRVHPLNPNPTIIYKTKDGAWEPTSFEQFQPVEPLLIVSFPTSLPSSVVKQHFNPFGAKSYEPLINVDDDGTSLKLKIIFDSFFNTKVALEALIDLDLVINGVKVDVEGFIQKPEPLIKPKLEEKRSRYIDFEHNVGDVAGIDKGNILVDISRAHSPEISTEPSPKRSRRSISPSAFFEEPSRSRRSPSERLPRREKKKDDSDKNRNRHNKRKPNKLFKNQESVRYLIVFDNYMSGRDTVEKIKSMRINKGVQSNDRPSFRECFAFFPSDCSLDVIRRNLKQKFPGLNVDVMKDDKR